MNRALRWRASLRVVCAVALVSGFGCGSEEEGSGNNAFTTGGTGGSTGGVGGSTGGVGGSSGAAGMVVTGGVGGATGGVGGSTGGVGGATGGVGGATGGVGGASGMGGGDPDAGMMDPDSGMAGMSGMGGTGGDADCCPDGNCICREAPSGLTSSEGPYDVESYDLRGVGCVYYPTNAEPPFAAIAISDGYLGTGGCGRTQTSGWGPLYASHGIVAMIVETGSGDSPAVRGARLAEGIEGFKAENENSSSPLFEQLAGRYGTSGFSMGGGGTTYAAEDDPSLLASVAIMPYRPVSRGTVPTLYICGSSDRTASCSGHAQPSYRGLPDSTDKMIITVSSGHAGQPTAGSGDSGEVGLAFSKLYLEGDERWREVLLSADYDDTNIE